MKSWLVNTMERIEEVEHKVNSISVDYRLLVQNLDSMQNQLSRIEDLVNKLIDAQLNKSN